MRWLEATLAFAVTMLVFSTMVSILVETLHRIFGLREKGLQLMLKRFFHHVIQPQIAEFDGSDTNVLTMSASGEVLPSVYSVTMSSNRAPIGPVVGEMPINGSGELGWRARIKRYWDFLPISWIWNGSQLNHLTLDEFMERLGSCEIGQALLQKADAVGDAILQDIAMKYEAFSNEAREYFTRRARLTSVILAVCFSTYLQLNAVDIFVSYLKDPQLAKTVIAGTQTAVGKHLAQQQKLEKILNDLKNSADNNNNTQTDDQIEEISKNIENIQKNLSELNAAIVSPGVPKFVTDLQYRWQNSSGANNKARSFWEWLKISAGGIGISIFTGLLIGLGGPFWHDTIQALTQFSNLVRALMPGVISSQNSDTVSGSQKSGAVAGQKEVVQPKTPVDIFKIAAKAAASKQTGRPLLSPDGTVEDAVNLP